MEEKNKKKVVIEATKDGPYLVKVDGNVIAALCRCGASNDKPYCDGSHKKIGFKADSHKIEVEN